MLEPARDRVEAGGELEVVGQRFSATTRYRLVLKGALSEHELGTAVETDADGGFDVRLSIPQEVEPGAYRLVAVAPDGDDAAEVDVEVLPAVTDSASSEAGQGAADAGSTTRVPSAEELNIERRWTGVEWFVVGVLFGGALAGGIALYRGGRKLA